MAATVEPIRDRKDIEAIKAVLRAKDYPRDYLLFVMGINLGLRISDVLRLRISDVLTKEGRVQDYIYLREKKTSKERKIAVNRAVEEAIRYWKKRLGRYRPDQLLFTSLRSGNPLTRIRVWQMIREWCAAAGVDGRHFGTHTLRKTYGYQARKHGIGAKMIQQKFGHRNAEVTDIYIGITQDEINEMERSFNL